MSGRRFDQLLRWYPPRWRARYGAELAALLEDTYSLASEVPRRQRLALVRSGLAERAHDAGLVGSSNAADEQLRGGSLLILCGWALFMAAGAAFGKLSDNWLSGTPVSGRWPASTAYDAVVVTGTAGCVLVVVAASAVGPAFVGLVRRGGWRAVRGAVWRAGMAVALAAALFGGTVAWAHQLSTHARNGGNHLYGALFVALVVGALVALGCATAAAIRVARRLDVRGPALPGSLALGVTLLMLVVFTGFVTWWVAEALHAPGVLQSSIGNGLPFTSTLVPPSLLAAGLLVVVGLALGIWGSFRVAGPVLRRGYLPDQGR